MSTPPDTYRTIGSAIERILRGLIRLGQVGLGLSTAGTFILLIYLLVTGQIELSHLFSSAGSSIPVLSVISIAGISLCLLNGSLVLYLLFTGIEDSQDGISAITSCIGFSFGAGLLRVTIPPLLFA